MKNKISNYLNLIATVNAIILTIIFLFFNPYKQEEINLGHVISLTCLLILPSIVSLLFSLMNKKLLAIIAAIITLPLCLYFGVAKIPSVFNLYLLTPIFYLFGTKFRFFSEKV
ncbi:hypothetical protein BC351_30150 [Paenibacillus ferrarius]|uniref:Uncharacterized protein n=1 Tax=Paenibacillus ferrarius TaxID=1469647 RepID=A0A1V4HGV9_9BACL|nr:hypothetical protein [Paenibacillus ferrarius]OPH54985.1 hypothetical protein BC351_30150 [Paenibacillus ferrarius]